MEEIERDLSNAPNAFTHKSVKQWLVDHGAMGVLSISAISLIVGVSKRTIKDAERAGKLKNIDKCTYELDAVVDWLVKNPRHMAQGTRYFKVTEETLENVKKIIRNRFQGLLQFWNNDIDDLALETCYKLSTTPLGAACSESLIIIRALNKIWHSKDVQNRKMTVPLETINSREVL